LQLQIRKSTARVDSRIESFVAQGQSAPGHLAYGSNTEVEQLTAASLRLKSVSLNLKKPLSNRCEQLTAASV
jgi:hypothetical protein